MSDLERAKRMARLVKAGLMPTTPFNIDEHLREKDEVIAYLAAVADEGDRAQFEDALEICLRAFRGGGQSEPEET